MAFEELLVPWRNERVLCDDGDFLAVDKPAGLVVHGGDARFPGDVVRRLSQWLRASGRDDYLGVHQRLDKDASGVLFFTRRKEHNALVASQMESRAVEKVYVAAVTLKGARDLAEEGVLEDRLAAGRDGRTQVVRSGGQHARARYRTLAQRSDRALIELRLETGRTHQLRVQLASRGAPIAGDRLYGGAPASRMMLHASTLAIPALGRCFAAALPTEISDWLEARPPSLGSSEKLRQRLADAACLRSPLRETADAFRLVNDLGDGLPGVAIDRYGDHAVLAVSEDEAMARSQELADDLVQLGVRGVYLVVRARADLRKLDPEALAPAKPIAGEPAPEELIVNEAGLRLAVRLGAALSTGLFVDQRDNRARICQLSTGARVLNLFCYTCSFSVAAAQGGATSTVNIDLSGRALELGRRNFELNGIDHARHRFIKADVVEWLRRAARQGERFDVVVLDPPSFSSVGKATFRAASDFTSVAASAMALLASQGKLLAVTNHRGTSLARLRQMLHEAARAARRHITQLKDLPSQLDCPNLPEGAYPSKSVLLTLK